MLPFLKRERKETGIIVEHRKPDVEPKDEAEDDSLETAVDDFFKAYAARDIKAGAAALRAAFQIVDAEPHHEGEHLDESEEE